MDLHSFVNGRGRQSALAAQIGAQPQLLYQWAKGVRPAPPDRCPDIERATEGAVTCEELRPDIRWQRVPDAAWPHPAGRPCIDVATPTSTTAVPAPATEASA